MVFAPKLRKKNLPVREADKGPERQVAVKLYLHIGYPKCGSSTIQEALHLNRVALRGLGVGVCGAKLELMGRRARHKFPIGYFLDVAKVVRAGGSVDLRPEFEALHKRAVRAGLESVVISAENLGAPWAAEAIAVAQDYFDCEIVLYVRRQDDWVLSAWAQWHFKSGESLPAYVDRRVREGRETMYREVIEAYRASFGACPMTVRLLSRGHLVGGDLVSDFWHALGLDAAGLEPAVSRNVSFSVPLVNTLRESPHLFDGAHDNRLTEFIDAYHRYRGASKKDAFSVAHRRRILEKYAEENAWLAANVFSRQDLGDWLTLPDEDVSEAKMETRRRDEPSLRGIAEVVNLNTAMLYRMREDVDRIKLSLGLK